MMERHWYHYFLHNQRAELAREGLVPAADLASVPVGRRVAIAGLVLIRQRPGSANGVVFVTLEDETGIANLIVWPQTLERFRRAALGATLLACRGRLQREAGVIHVIAEQLHDLTQRKGGKCEIDAAGAQDRHRHNQRHQSGNHSGAWNGQQGRQLENVAEIGRGIGADRRKPGKTKIELPGGERQETAVGKHHVHRKLPAREINTGRR